jgi:hypothetical protein
VIPSISGEANPGGSVAVDEEGVYSARFADQTLGQTILGNATAPPPAITAGDQDDAAPLSHTPAGDGGASPSPLVFPSLRGCPQVGKSHPVGEDGHRITLHEIANDGRQHWQVIDPADIRHATIWAGKQLRSPAVN